jgi:hypothetical protein
MSPEPRRARPDEPAQAQTPHTDPTTSEPEPQTTEGGEDPGKRWEEALEKGYFGEVPGPDRDQYTLKTGPDSPSAAEELVAAAEQRVKDLKATIHKED